MVEVPFMIVVGFGTQEIKVKLIFFKQSALPRHGGQGWLWNWNYFFFF